MAVPPRTRPQRAWLDRLFSLSYFDSDWQEIEELHVDDATREETLLAVWRWVDWNPKADGERNGSTTALHNAAFLTLEGYDA